MTTKQQQYLRTAQDRRTRAYQYLKAWAIREGWMAHQRDSEGFDRFMDSLESKENKMEAYYKENEYKKAKKHSDKTGEPLWDTKTLPWKYVVGWLTIETEEDPDNADWEQLPPENES